MLSGGGRRGMGGGGGGGGSGGGILRSIQRVRTGVGSALSNSKTTIGDKAKNLKSNRATSPTRSISISPYASPLVTNIPTRDESEWEYIENETTGHDLFGSVPSRDEVHHAVSALQQALYCSATENTSDGDDDDEEKRMEWYEPSQSLYNWRVPRSDMAYEAFHLLETQPSVQRMVASLSCDEAVWKAVMNNEAVKELRESIHQDGESLIFSDDEEEKKGSSKKKNILKWIVMFAKERMKQLMTVLMNNNNDDDDSGGAVEGGMKQRAVKASVLMSIVVLIIVILNRANPSTIR